VHEEKPYQRALVHWFSGVVTEPDEDTGLWEVKPEFNDNEPDLTIVHVDLSLLTSSLSTILHSIFPDHLYPRRLQRILCQ